MAWLIILLALIGFGIALYAFILEKKVMQSPDFKPFCDISHGISCTKPLKSQYANLLFISNATLAMIFYTIVIISIFFNATTFLFIASLISVLFTIVLAYLLFFKIKSFCILCTSLYTINFLIFLLALFKFLS